MSSDDDELSQLEAMANSISDGSDTDSEDESEPEGPVTAKDDPLNVTPTKTEKSKGETPKDNNTEELNSTSDTIVTINVEGIKPENVIISETDIKELSVSSLTSIPSISSSLSGSKLQDIFDDIGTSDNIEENIQESNEVEHAAEPTDAEARNNDLFSGYNLDDILRRNSEEADGNEHLDLDEEPEDVEESDVSSSDDDEMENDYNSLQDMCDNYLDNLTVLLQTLQKELDRNLSRQNEIDIKVSDMNFTQLMKAQSSRSKHRVLARKPVSIFASPYFKDKDLYGPPPNEDTKRKRLNKELDVWIEFPRPFSEDERRRLKMYVREDAIRIKSLKLRQEKENIESKLNSFVFDEKVKEDLSNQLISVNQQIGEIQSLPDDKMFVDRFEEYDWEKISVTNFNNVHSPKECELQWQNLVHPTINRSVFSPEEDKLLKRLSEALKAQDWDSVAREMETGRTGHACFVRYMTRHNVTINNRKWEKSEDDRLRRLIAHCRINNYIPWTKVSYYMERRTKDQCYQRYVYSLKDIIKKGPFSDAEDILLFIGEKLYKNDWAKISEIIPCRTAIQLHSRYNHFLKADHKPWTEDEDVALLEQVRKHGLRDWVLISQQLAVNFGGERTRGQCRQRFAYIYKCFKKNPALALGSVEYKEESGLTKRRLDDVYDKLSERFEEFKAAEEAAGVIDTVGVSEGSTFGYIVLPNGERISRKSLTKFIRFIQEFLPKPNPQTPMPRPLEVRSKRTLPNHEEEELFLKPLKKSGNFNNKQKKLKVAGYEHKKFKTYKNNRKGARNRDKVGQAAFKTLLDRNISKFFRPTWIMKNRLNLCSSYGDKDLEMLTTAGLKLAKILSVKNLSVEHDEETPENKNNQLFLNFLQSNETSVSSQTSPSCKVAKTYGRTYSRKAMKRSDSRSATPSSTQTTGINDEDIIDLVPPSMSTLVGFRGVLLTNAYLADPTNHAANIRKEKDYVDKTVMEGAVSADLDLDNDGVAVCSNDSHLAADQLLVKRFLQLFLWPAKMSNVAPTNQEDLFSDEDEEEEVIVENNEEC